MTYTAPSYPEATGSFDAQVKAKQARAVALGRVMWRSISPNHLSASWDEALPILAAGVSKVQSQAATLGAEYVGPAVAQVGSYAPPDGFVAPDALAGWVPDGRPLESLLVGPVFRVKEFIAAGISVPQALLLGRRNLDRRLSLAVADTARVASGMDIATRRGIGYVRMLNPPSCPRCIILAGKFFRWNEGFLRHPHCDCKHIPTSENAAGDLTTDPYEFFHSLTPQEQQQIFTKAGAAAINDGADMFQVVNARRGMTYAGQSIDGSHRGQKIISGFTTEGTTKRGNFRQNTPGGSLTHGRRLTPEEIYRLNGTNRTAALADLEKYGYILPGGQNPLGSLWKTHPGAGGAEHLTAAQSRLLNATLRWEAVLAGRNPAGGTLTPAVAAMIERDYRRWLASKGEIFS